MAFADELGGTLMRRQAVIASLLAGLLGTTSGAGERADLERRMLDHLNARMYGSCQGVVLDRQSDGIREGYVRFYNGRVSRLEVRVSPDGIEYVLGERPKNPPRASETIDALEAARTRLRELLDRVERQKNEIARLEARSREDDAATTSEPERTSPRPGTPSSGGAFSQGHPDGPNGGFVTRDGYDRIEKGLSASSVAEVFGGSGVLLSASRFDGALNEVYVWTNPDDSHACVVFRDGKVLVKTQFGLDVPIR
jgi:hypothetical protein